MSLAPGTRLGPYEIADKLGEGGMGQVYRARDTRLDRAVAIKVLSPRVAHGDDLRARFEREARAISALNHPHICALYDIGRHGETDYLVMELVEGESLADRLARGPLPLAQVVRHGREIADALHRAHRQGIVHRDLKPGNVMLTKAGVKLLDFGLAKLQAPVHGVGSQSVLASVPTRLEQPLTAHGTLLGTFQYMAPEQLEGKDADARADLWALGCVIYEMATGRVAFTGASPASLISAVMSAEPRPISELQPLAPPSLEQLVRACLAKDPEDRWQNAHDVSRALQWISEVGSARAEGGATPERDRRRPHLAWAVATLAAAAALAAIVVAVRFAGRPAGAERPIRASILLDDKSALRAAALAPDGTRFVFVARDAAGRNLLWIRELDSDAARPLVGTENPSFPFWSPDGRFIGFFADGRLKKVEASGAPPETLCYAPIARGGTWNRQGEILFTPVADAPIYRIPASGGSPTPVTRFDPARGESSHRWPFFLPDGRHFLYQVASFGSGAQEERLGIYVGSLDGDEERFVMRANSSVVYVPSPSDAERGQLVFQRDQNLVAQPFDAKGLRTTGDPVVVADSVQFFQQTHYAFLSAAPDGVLLYQAASAAGLSQLAWFDRRGQRTGSLGEQGVIANPRISPDGRRVAVDIVDPQTANDDLWIYDVSGGLPTRLTSDRAFDNQAVWSPDGSRVVFMSLRRGRADLYEMSSSGGREQEFFRSDVTKYPNDWSPDGRVILYREFSPTTNFELWTLAVSGERQPTPFLKAKYGLSHGQFSPDGRWVAYASNESGRWEIYVTSFPEPGGNWKVSAAGGSEPRWRRDGSELFYLAPDGQLMAVAVKAGPTFAAGTAQPLFRARLRQHISSADLFSYDVSPDGRFLVNTDVGEVNPTPLTIVTGWRRQPGTSPR